MTQVSANARGKPNHHPSADLSVNTSPSLPPAQLLITGMLIAAGVSLALATRAPLAVTVLGLIIFGVLHNILEIRYVAGRFASLLTGRFLILLLSLTSGIALCRLSAQFWPDVARYAEIGIGYLILLLILTSGIALCRLTAQFWPDVARYAEIGIGYLILLAGCRIGLRGGWLVVAVAVLAVAAIGSFSYPAYHFVVLTHLHNLVPLIFLWDWARRITQPRERLGFRLTQVLWIVILPLSILLGSVDRWISAGPGVVARFVGDGSRVIAGAAPPESATQIGLRFLVMFAFMQTMHYVVWVGFLPRFAPDATAAFDARVPWLAGRRAWLVGLGAGAFLAVLFLSDYFQGRALYGALATYHAYLEFPVLLALLMAPRQFMTATPLIPATRR